MSKNITIQEGGVGKTLSSISKLETKKQGGGSVIWIPEEEANLKTKHITSNGTYTAESDNAYGFSEVSVNVTSGSTSGIKTGSGTPIEQGGNGNDNEYNVETDGQTGELEETLLPSSIKIEGLPTKIEYNDEESINKAGIVVKAYQNDGILYNYSGYQAGAIPLSELELEPTTADYSKTENHSEAYIQDTTGFDAEIIRAMPFEYIKGIASITKIDYIFESGGGYYGGREDGATPFEDIVENDTVYVTAFDYTRINLFHEMDVIAFSKSPFSCHPWTHNQYGVYDGRVQNAQRGTYKNKEFYYLMLKTSAASAHLESNIVFQKLPDVNNSYNTLQIGYIVLYGTHVENEGKQEITVKWKRPKDEKELTDTFKITVNPVNETNGSTGGNDTGGGSSW